VIWVIVARSRFSVKNLIAWKRRDYKLDDDVAKMHKNHRKGSVGDIDYAA
jgi:hypothetical protein